MSISILIIGCCYLAVLYLNLVAREVALICLVFTETALGILGFEQGMEELRCDSYLVSTGPAVVDLLLRDRVLPVTQQ